MLIDNALIHILNGSGRAQTETICYSASYEKHFSAGNRKMDAETDI